MAFLTNAGTWEHMAVRTNVQVPYDVPTLPQKTAEFAQKGTALTPVHLNGAARPTPNLSKSADTPTPDEVFAAATRYVGAGLSVIPIAPDGSKSPAWGLLPKICKPDGKVKHAWKPFQSRRATSAEIESWYTGWGPLCGIAVIGGEISGGLEMIDFDTADLVEPWRELVTAQNAALLDRLVMVRTPRPGVHVYYRCVVADSSQKLARRIETDPETHIPREKTLIETKGEGGYVLAPPSPGYCHSSGRQYQYLTGRDLTAVAMITPEDREILLEAARSFDVTPPPVETPLSSQSKAVSAKSSRHELPGDDFNARGDWAEILERNGWTYAGDDGAGKEFWCRPGKTDGVSATLNNEGYDLLHNFSTSASPLEPEKSYTKFGFVALIEHDGDFQKAAQALREQGYGRPPIPAGSRRRRRSQRRNSRRR